MKDPSSVHESQPDVTWGKNTWLIKIRKSLKSSCYGCSARQVWPKLWASTWLTWEPLRLGQYTAGYVCVGVSRRTGSWIYCWPSQWLTPLKDWNLDRILRGNGTVEMRWVGESGVSGYAMKDVPEPGSFPSLFHLLHHALSLWSCLKQT